MNTVKNLAIVALLVGGTSLAMAQNPAQNPPHPGVVPGAPAQSAAPTAAPGAPAQAAATAPSRTRIVHHTTRHPKNMYMSAKSHKGSKLTPTNNAKPQMKQ